VSSAAAPRTPTIATPPCHGRSAASSGSAGCSGCARSPCRSAPVTAGVSLRFRVGPGLAGTTAPNPWRTKRCTVFSCSPKAAATSRVVASPLVPTLSIATRSATGHPRRICAAAWHRTSPRSDHRCAARSADH
jgi:hypothetical protein